MRRLTSLSFILLLSVALLLTAFAGCTGQTPADSFDTPESGAVSLESETEADSAESPGEQSAPDTSSSEDVANTTTAGGNAPSKSETAGRNTSFASSSRTAAQNTGKLGTFLMMTPTHGALLDSTALTATWSESTNAETYTLVLEQYRNNKFTVVKRFTGLTGLTYTVKPLAADAIYRWSVCAVNSAGELAGTGGNGTDGNVIMTPINVKSHPANKGLNFDFDGKISKEVLCNYLSRSMTVSGGLSGTEEYVQSNIRMILNTGVKYAGRAGCNWNVTKSQIDKLTDVKAAISRAHTVDPDIIFEACIFECVSKKADKIAIPSWVFQAFGLTPETRNFRYDKMIFPGGAYVNQWGTDASAPDITQLETRMFFYFLARSYIDAGFEALHMGQIHMIGAHDTGWKYYTELNSMIRAYAQKSARRYFVLLNAHTHGIKDANGKLMFDFHEFPMRGKVPAGSTAHMPTEDNPQIIEFEVGYTDAIYKDSLGGMTYSGWSCDSLPYTVELDNYGVTGSKVNTTASHWGYDEISWYANQPASYRHKWLSYAYTWVHHTDPVGYFMMPGVRTAYLCSKTGVVTASTYVNHSTLFNAKGFDDENAIRSIFVQSNK